MKHYFPFVVIFILLCNSGGYCQKPHKIIELRGRIDGLGNTIIQILPTNEKRTNYTALEVKEVNSIISQYKGSAINVLNGLLVNGYELISALYVCNDVANNYNGNFSVYYLKHPGLKIKEQQ